jgi:hypothetical protein
MGVVESRLAIPERADRPLPNSAFAPPVWSQILGVAERTVRALVHSCISCCGPRPALPHQYAALTRQHLKKDETLKQALQTLLSS